MPISYRGLSMQIVYTRNIGREVVMSRDGVAYETQKWTFDVDAIYNPAATSFAPDPAGDNVRLPAARRGVMAPTTDVAVRDWLNQPRGQLVYTLGGITLLSTPAPGYTSDARLGPLVERCDVKEIPGDKTFLVSLRITTHVNEGPRLSLARGKAGPSFHVLLSNRWREYVDQDQDYFVQRIVEGEAVFRVDELESRGHVADNYRASVLPPLAPNFARIAEQVVPSEDRSRLTYRVVDQEMPFNNAALYPNVTRVEAYETRQVFAPCIWDALALGLSTSIGNMVEANRRTTGPVGTGRVRGNVERRDAVVSAAVRGIIGITRAVAPTLVSQALARVWGHRNCRRFDMAALAVAICYARIGPPTPDSTTSMQLSAEVSGKFVEFNVTHTRMKWVLPIFSSAGNDVPFNNTALFATDVAANDNTGNLLFQQNARNNAPPPNSNGTRGTWNGQIAAAPAPLPHTDPAAWPAVPVADNVDRAPP